MRRTGGAFTLCALLSTLTVTLCAYGNSTELHVAEVVTEGQPIRAEVVTESTTMQTTENEFVPVKDTAMPEPFYTPTSDSEARCA